MRHALLHTRSTRTGDGGYGLLPDLRPNARHLAVAPLLLRTLHAADHSSCAAASACSRRVHLPNGPTDAGGQVRVQRLAWGACGLLASSWLPLLTAARPQPIRPCFASPATMPQSAMPCRFLKSQAQQQPVPLLLHHPAAQHELLPGKPAARLLERASLLLRLLERRPPPPLLVHADVCVCVHTRLPACGAGC